MTTLALFGAAGKMGSRLTQRLREAPQNTTLYVEPENVLREVKAITQGISVK